MQQHFHSYSLLFKFEKINHMRLLLSFLFIHSFLVGYTQFTQADSLRGGYGSGRNWWNLTHYDLHVSFHIDEQGISGYNTISFEAIKIPETGAAIMQLDLQDPMILDSVIDEQTGQKLHWEKNGFAYFITTKTIKPSANQYTAYFHGKPRIAKMAPWDGGLIWSKDKNSKPWITIACQGLGASMWFPCKDSQVDEPDYGVTMHYTCPENLVCVSNGMFQQKQIHANQTATYTWMVKNPINNYSMIPYIGDYVNLHEHYVGENGILELDYWVLRGNEEKAEKQFQDAPRTLKALEYWFGPYPFYEDGYKLIEAPHLGMEHQSAIAYGNDFQNGYRGADLSGSGEGLKWDFIIIHESGHEWFGNNITSKDIADMWIHEGFTSYSETLFTEFWFGKQAADKYNRGIRRNIENNRPIIGQYGVHNEGSGDMYYKGANMLHTIRTLVQNDSLFRHMLRKMNAQFRHQTVTTQEIEAFMSAELKMDLQRIFDQYLREKNPPILQVKTKKKQTQFRWINCVEGFNMPILHENRLIPCTSKWTKYTSSDASPFVIEPNLYIRKVNK